MCVDFGSDVRRGREGSRSEQCEQQQAHRERFRELYRGARAPLPVDYDENGFDWVSGLSVGLQEASGAREGNGKEDPDLERHGTNRLASSANRFIPRCIAS